MELSDETGLYRLVTRKRDIDAERATSGRDFTAGAFLLKAKETYLSAHQSVGWSPEAYAANSHLKGIVGVSGFTVAHCREAGLHSVELDEELLDEPRHVKAWGMPVWEYKDSDEYKRAEDMAGEMARRARLVWSVAK